MFEVENKVAGALDLEAAGLVTGEDLTERFLGEHDEAGEGGEFRQGLGDGLAGVGAGGRALSDIAEACEGGSEEDVASALPASLDSDGGGRGGRSDLLESEHEGRRGG
jgi:hypothetical protein